MTTTRTNREIVRISGISFAVTEINEGNRGKL